MCVAHHTVGKFLPFSIELPGEFDLLAHKFGLPRKVQMDVGRSAIRTEQRDRVDAVIAPAFVAHQFAQEIASGEARRGLGRWPRVLSLSSETCCRQSPGRARRNMS